MYGYIYETTNLINGKKYIGKHKRNDFDPKYKGSGQNLKRAFSKYGRNNFKCTLIEKCNDLQDLNAKETFWINKYRNEGYALYNITDGGDGSKGYSHTDQTKRLISSYSKNRVWITKDGRNKFIKKEDVCKYLDSGWITGRIFNPPSDPSKRKTKISQKNKGRVRMTNGQVNVFIYRKDVSKYESLGYYYGVTKLSFKNWIWINNTIESKRILLEELDNYLPLGWKRGRISTMSEEAKLKLSMLYKGKSHPVSEDTKRKISLKRMNHSVDHNTKIQISNTLKNYYKSAEGIRKRQYLSKVAKCRSNKTKDTVWINNGKVNKRIPKNELPEYLSNSWTKGVL